MPGPTVREGGFAPVLVAAGDEAVRSAIATRLETLGPVVCAATIAEAIVCAETGLRVAVIVPPLPGSAGAEALDDLRACQPLCPIVAVVEDLESPLAAACAQREHVVLLAESAVPSEVLVVAVRAARASADSVDARLARARTVFEHLREAVLVHSPSGRIVLANPAARALLGAVGAAPGELVLHDRAGNPLPADATPAACALREGRPVGPAVQTLVRPDGTVRRVDCVVHPLMSAGRACGTVSLLWDVTEDEERRAALLAAEQLRFGVDELGLQARLVVDGSGCVSAAQSGASGLLDASGVLGRPVEELVHPHDRPRLAGLLAAASPPEVGVVRAELRALDPGGNVRHVEIAALRHDDGHAPGATSIVLSLHDITRRRGLSESVARLAAIVEDSGDAVIAEGDSGRITTWNSAAERLYGTPAADALGESSLRLVPWRQRPDVLALAHSLRAGEIARARRRVEVLRLDGSSGTLELTALPAHGSDGQVTSISWVGRDVTEARRQEAERERTTEHFRLGFEYGAIGMAIIDAATETIFEVNTALCRFLGRAAAEVRERRLTEFLHPADAGADDSMPALLAAGQRHHRDERRYLRPDGTVVWGHAEVVLVEDPARAQPYYFAQVQDVTERRLAEEALTHQARHDPLTGLPNRVLLADRLDQALKRAQRSGLWVAMLLVDLDGFKEVNDRHGHGCGDRLLAEIAARLSGGVRASDTVARLGGDEFVVVCEEVADESGAHKLGETITGLFAEPFLIEGTELTLTSSCGVVLLGPHVSVEEALEHADSAMYAAKAQGGNRATIVDRTAPGANLKVVH